jgi:hypothetical protein
LRRITGIALSTLVATAGMAAVQGGTAHATEPGADGMLTASGTTGVVEIGSDGVGRTLP